VLFPLRPSSIIGIVAHHSGNKNSTLEALKLWHDKYIGEKTGKRAYNFVVTKDGRFLSWFGDKYITGHCGVDGWYNWKTPCNFNTISVCFLGNFQVDQIEEKQFKAGVEGIKWLMDKFKIPQGNIWRHRDIYKGTVCPGKNFPFERLKEEVKGMTLGDIKGSEYGKILLKLFVEKGIIKNPEKHTDLTKPFTKEETLALLFNIVKKLDIFGG